VRRILITGGTGYLGTELLQQARAGAWEVGATSFSHLPQDDGVAWMQLDIRDEPAVTRAVKGSSETGSTASPSENRRCISR